MLRRTVEGSWAWFGLFLLSPYHRQILARVRQERRQLRCPVLVQVHFERDGAAVVFPGDVNTSAQRLDQQQDVTAGAFTNFLPVRSCPAELLLEEVRDGVGWA